MKNKHNMFLVLMIFTLIAAVSAMREEKRASSARLRRSGTVRPGGGRGAGEWMMPSGGSWA